MRTNWGLDLVDMPTLDSLMMKGLWVAIRHLILVEGFPMITLRIIAHVKTLYQWLVLFTIQSKWVQPRAFSFHLSEMLYFFYFMVLLILGCWAWPRYPGKTGIPQPLLWGFLCFFWGLPLTLQVSRMTLNFWSHFLYLPSAGITGIHHFSWFIKCWGLNLGICSC